MLNHVPLYKFKWKYLSHTHMSPFYYLSLFSLPWTYLCFALFIIFVMAIIVIELSFSKLLVSVPHFPSTNKFNNSSYNEINCYIFFCNLYILVILYKCHSLICQYLKFYYNLSMTTGIYLIQYIHFLKFRANRKLQI